MSAHWLKKLVLAAALVVMPLQGVAAAMSAPACHDEVQAHATHDGGGHDHGSPHDDGGGASGSYHPCCNFTVCAPSAITLPGALPDFPIRAFAPDPLHDLFIPDQPQRPPLA